MTESPSVHVFVIFTDVVSGTEHIIRRQYSGTDEGWSASEAFASLEGSQVRIREILSFEQQPRRWKPDFQVSELPNPRHP